jgi:hypothetical protein
MKEIRNILWDYIFIILLTFSPSFIIYSYKQRQEYETFGKNTVFKSQIRKETHV